MYPTIWQALTNSVFKLQASAVNRCSEKCDRNFCNGRTDIQTHKGKTVYPLFLRRVGIIKKPAIIKKSTSPFYSPVALVKKGNSEYRFCIDFTKPMSFTIITFQRKISKKTTEK